MTLKNISRSVGLVAANENSPRVPERALYGSLILTAVLDALEDQPVRINAPEKYKKRYKVDMIVEALKWLGIEKSGEEYTVTFEFCCEAINRDPERVRSAIKKFVLENRRVGFYPNPPILARVLREG